MFNPFVLKRKVCNSCGELATFCCPKCRIRLCYKCNTTLILENLKKIDTCFKCGGKQVISIACVIRFCFSEKCAKITIYFFESNFEIRERSRGVGRRWADRAASWIFINFSIGTLSDEYHLATNIIWLYAFFGLPQTLPFELISSAENWCELTDMRFYIFSLFQALCLVNMLSAR